MTSSRLCSSPQAASCVTMPNMKARHLTLVLAISSALAGCSEYSDVYHQNMKSGAVFSGRLKADSFARPDGAGTMVYPDGSRYEGNWFHGGYDGDGHFSRPDGTDYRGVFRNDGPWQVTGRMHFPDGSWYQGTWNRQTGRGGGWIWWPDGRYYAGTWLVPGDEKALPDGDGELIYPDGSRYVGRFLDGLPDGYGTLTSPAGLKTTGIFRKGSIDQASK